MICLPFSMAELSHGAAQKALERKAAEWGRSCWSIAMNRYHSIFLEDGDLGMTCCDGQRPCSAVLGSALSGWGFHRPSGFIQFPIKHMTPISTLLCWIWDEWGSCSVSHQKKESYMFNVVHRPIPGRFVYLQPSHTVILSYLPFQGNR